MELYENGSLPLLQRNGTDLIEVDPDVGTIDTSATTYNSDKTQSQAINSYSNPVYYSSSHDKSNTYYGVNSAESNKKSTYSPNYYSPNYFNTDGYDRYYKPWTKAQWKSASER